MFYLFHFGIFIKSITYYLPYNENEIPTHVLVFSDPLGVRGSFSFTQDPGCSYEIIISNLFLEAKKRGLIGFLC